MLRRDDSQAGRKMKENTVEDKRSTQNWPHREGAGVISGRGTNRQRHGAYTENYAYSVLNFEPGTFTNVLIGPIE